MVVVAILFAAALRAARADANGVRLHGGTDLLVMTCIAN